ncbi:MAG TPA: translocation/assembly module TamB, partial [Caulobacteraceae bacterium]|nr:translocation/assembly module TamB [Caulobacteraceae bacterium]
MSAGGPEPAASAAPPGETPPLAPPRRGRRRLALYLWTVALAVVAVIVAGRYGPVTPGGRAFVEGLLDGLKAGPYGQVHVEGLEGDIWGDFTIRRLTVNDVHGTWLDARWIRMRWKWSELLSRRLDVDAADARLVTVLRQPVAAATPASRGGSPVSVHIGALTTQLELLPAFSTRYGLYDLSGSMDLRREGGAAGRLAAASRTHVGDRVDADFDLGRDKTIRLAVQAHEANGGALAGALGLAADQPFAVNASASGAVSQGRFHVDSRSGPLVPLAADGAWTPQGGAATGAIVLAASRRLAWFQHWFGPDVRFSVTGAKAPDALHDLVLRLTSENIELTAHGEADIGHRLVGRKGVLVAILARQGQRFLGFPQMGGARLNGLLTGGGDHWTLAGVAQADDPTAFGYRLASVRGPVTFEWKGGQLDIGATADGAGGAGRGVIAAVMGARPHATAQLVWLTDGRVLIQSLNVLGPGLKVAARGDRSPFGGLSFRGQAS